MNKTHNKQVVLNTKAKVMKLKGLVQDAVDSKFNPKLIKKFKKQLKDQEEILNKDMEKKARPKEQEKNKC